MKRELKGRYLFICWKSALFSPSLPLLRARAHDKTEEKSKYMTSLRPEAAHQLTDEGQDIHIPTRLFLSKVLFLRGGGRYIIRPDLVYSVLYQFWSISCIASALLIGY